MAQPDLTGLSVIVTRPAGTGDALAARLHALGAQVLQFPAIVIQPLPLDAVAYDSLRALHTFDFAVFVSPSAAARFFEVWPNRWPDNLVAAAVGPGTAKILGKYGVSRVMEPRAGAGAEALLKNPALTDLNGKRIVIIAGAGGRDLLENTLHARGAQVTLLQLYRRVPPADGRPLFRWLNQRPRSVLLVTSNAALGHLDQLAAGADRRRLFDAQLVVPSPRVVKKAESLGYRHIVRAADASDAALIAALAERQWSNDE